MNNNLEKEKIIGAAHTHIVRKRGKGLEYTPSVHEIQEVVDNFILRIDKGTNEYEFVSMEYAVQRLKNSYLNGDMCLVETLRKGVILQNNFCYYQSLPNSNFWRKVNR